jgi:hypothetical protein
MTQEQCSFAQYEATLERIAAKQRCVMFLHGMCLGGIYTALAMQHAYGLLAFLLVFHAGWFAWWGWPWKL